jgi:alkane 1-monooxygenase
MHTRWLYLIAFTLPLVTLFSILTGGWWSYGTVVEAFVLIPLFELILAPNPAGPSPSESTALSGERFYDYLLYAMVPLQWLTLLLFFEKISDDRLLLFEQIGATLSMGVQCGAIGINVAHELGHRKNYLERFLAKSLLLSSLYMHFIVEHNEGHHRNVATPMDPATARKNETIYRFWIRTVIGSFLSAWRIELKRLKKHGLPRYHPSNEMLRAVIIQSALVLGVFFTFGLFASIAFLVAAFIGILLLETVNYIEHYGLIRMRSAEGKYERVQAWHSWNSDYPVGRIMLFELTRHSDHHHKASKKYQTLIHLPESPQLPTGYPGMMLLSLIPPLWFRVVNPLLRDINRLPQSGT